MTNHIHNFNYSDYVPAIGECKCKAYRVWNRELQAYQVYGQDENLEYMEHM